jgi:hypothetical protein
MAGDLTIEITTGLFADGATFFLMGDNEDVLLGLLLVVLHAGPVIFFCLLTPFVEEEEDSPPSPDNAVYFCDSLVAFFTAMLSGPSNTKMDLCLIPKLRNVVGPS